VFENEVIKGLDDGVREARQLLEKEKDLWVDGELSVGVEEEEEAVRPVIKIALQFKSLHNFKHSVDV
jgi:hypothetical protein